MFCKNCGSQIPDNIKFCGKCGTAVQQPARQRSRLSVPKSHGKQRDLKFPAFSHKTLVTGCGAVLLILIVAGICLGSRNGTPRLDRKMTAEESAEAGKEEQVHDDVTLDLTSPTALKGEYGSLRSLTMQPREDGLVDAITYSADASFPMLESLECGAVLKVLDSGEKVRFDEKDFPKLKNVTMKLTNKYIDEDVMETYMQFLEMYTVGSLQNFNVENSYTIEDLLGTWTDEKQTLTLTFEQDGTLRVADANNIIGVDMLKYKEAGKHTLSLSAEQSGLLGLISITMEYELFGDNLRVNFSGNEFMLTRK